MRPHIDYIKQDAAGADRAWKSFILNKSDGFTHPGVGRLNDSIRTYVWAILGAQAQTRTGILGAGAVDAQKQFRANVEDAIASPVDIPSAIRRYEDVLQHARSEVNFSFGDGLYMAPGDMLLRVGKGMGYNNLIIISTEKQRLGANIGLNKDVAQPDASNDTGEKGLVKPMSATRPSEATTSQLDAGAASASAATATTASTKADHEDHEDEKTALVVGGIAIGLGLLWFLSSHSRAATSSRPPTARSTAHKFPASQTAVFPRRDRSQETIEPIIPGKAAAALPASLARILPRLRRCFLIHSLAPPLPGGCGGVGVGAAPPPEPPVRARTSVDIVIPSAVRIVAIVMPCSRKSVRMRSPRVLFSCRSR